MCIKLVNSQQLIKRHCFEVDEFLHSMQPNATLPNGFSEQKKRRPEFIFEPQDVYIVQ